MMVELIPCYKSPEVVQPTNGSFDFPPLSISPEFSPVLSRRFDAIAFVRSDQIDATFEKPRTQRVAVGSFVVNQLFRAATYSAFSEQRLDEIDFVRTGTFNHIAARRTVAVDQQHDLGALTSFGLAYAKAPFLADENVPSAMDSSRSISPSRSSLLTRRDHAFLNKPDSDHCFNRRQHVGCDGK